MTLVDQRTRQNCFPTDEDIRNELDKAVNEKHWPWKLTLEHWWETSNLVDTPDHFLEIVNNWLSSSADIDHLNVAAHCIRFAGNRKHLIILDKSIVGSADTISRIREDVRFAVCLRSLD